MGNLGWSYPAGCDGPPDEDFDDTRCGVCLAKLPVPVTPESDGYCGDLCRTTGRIHWTAFTRRTDDPKLAWIESSLAALLVPFRRRGESFHAPILQVPSTRLAECQAWLAAPFGDDPAVSRDDVPDDDPAFRDPTDLADPGLDFP